MEEKELRDHYVIYAEVEGGEWKALGGLTEKEATDIYEKGTVSTVSSIYLTKFECALVTKVVKEKKYYDSTDQ